MCWYIDFSLSQYFFQFWPLTNSIIANNIDRHIPRWDPVLLTPELHHSVASMPSWDPRMHSAMFLSTETGDYCKHVQTCMKQAFKARKFAIE